MSCKRCNRPYDNPVPHCLQCRYHFKQLSLCSWCGVNPPTLRQNGTVTEYCNSCVAEANRVFGKLLFVHIPQSRYRDKYARENVYETKFGID